MTALELVRSAQGRNARSTSHAASLELLAACLRDLHTARWTRLCSTMAPTRSRHYGLVRRANHRRELDPAAARASTTADNSPRSVFRNAISRAKVDRRRNYVADELAKDCMDYGGLVFKIPFERVRRPRLACDGALFVTQQPVPSKGTQGDPGERRGAGAS